MKIYICSQLGGNGKIAENINFAEMKAREIALRGDVPICPHQIARYLNEQDKDERAVGMGIGVELLKICDEIHVFYGKDKMITQGMAAEVQYGILNEIPIRFIKVD